MSRLWVVRLSMIGLASAAALVAWKAAVPAPLPAVALGSEFLLRAEHGLVAFIAVLFGLVVLVNGIWDGELPSKITREGAEYPSKQAANQSEKATEALTKLTNRRWSILRRLWMAHESRLKALEARITELEESG